MIDSKIQQELRATFNPDGSILRSMQLSLLDILIEFDRICQANGVTYWIDSGTLLGAARHGGFIPWDDDLDVCILKKDHRKMKKALEKDLNAHFTFIDSNSWTGYTRRWGRVLNNRISVSRFVPKPDSKDETMIRTENIWLDIFYETNGVPSTSRRVDKFYGRCFRRRYRQINDGKIKHFIGVLLFPVAQLTVALARVWGRIFHPNNLIHDFGTGFYTQRNVDETFPLGWIEFEGHMFPAPGRYEDYLKRLYGNWEALPEKKESHNIQEIRGADKYN